jgi:Zn-dependent protease/predicted transcriptional regulator
MLRQGMDAYHIGWSLFFTLLIFGCVVLHELGHALTARRYGINTKSIVLLPIGGVANIERMPDKPRQEFWITVMGPMVNVVIAALLYPFVRVDFSNPAVFMELAVVSEETILWNLFAVNVFMVVFNLIPAFPMDGGRILRASLAAFMGWTRATRIAAGVGMVVAVIFIGYSIITFNLMLGLIGVFVAFAARSEKMMTTEKEILNRFRVKDIVITRFEQLESYDSIEKAAQMLLSTQSKQFVIADESTPVGTVTQQEIIKALSKGGASSPVKEYMNKGIYIVESEMPLYEAYEKLLQQPDGVLIVKNDSQWIGILDLENIKELLAFYSKGGFRFYAFGNLRTDVQFAVLKRHSIHR